MNNNGCIIPEIDEQNIGVQQENATFLVIGDEAYTSEIIEEYNRNAAAKTEEFNTNATNKTNDFNTNYDNKLEAFNSNAVTKTEDFDSHVTAQTTNFNNNAETATTNFNKNAAQQTDEFNKNAMSYSQGIEENKKNIASTSNELYHLKTDILETGESSGNNIHLEDSAWAEMQEIKVDGVCEQVTTTGANLYDYQNISNPSQEENGWITLSADNSSGSNYKYVNYFTRPMNLKPDTQYNVFVEIKNVSGTFSSLVISSDDVNVSTQQFVNPSWKATFSSLKSGYIVNKILTSKSDFSDVIIGLRTFLAFDAGNSGSVTFRISVIEDITITPANFVYQPFTNGQPSPSPDYPQEIKTITGDLKITSCGKNLFDMNKTSYPRIANGLTITAENGYFIINGTCNSTYANITNIMNFIIGAGTYTISIDAPQNFSVVLKRTFLDGSLADISIPANSLAKTFTTGRISNRYYFFIGGLTPGMTIDNAKFKIQFERKDNATSIEDYVESQIQANLPEGEFIGKLDETHKDTLRAEYFPEEGQYHWMLDKMVGMGDTSKYFGSVNRIATKQNKYRFTFDINTDKIPNSNTEPGVTYPLYCNKFIKGSRANTYAEINSIAYGTSSEPYSQFVLYYSEISSFTMVQFSDWLTNNPLIIYYILQTPYTIDLGPIDMPLTYDEITNIFTDSDLLPTINVKYYRNFTATIQNLQVNNDTLKNELSNIESRLTALESANTNIESRLTALENANKNVADSNPTEESEVTE